jgi:hypothetical protein
MRRLSATFVLLVSGLMAQQYADLSGLILDTSSGSVWGALVTVINEETGFRRSTFSQTDGWYVIASLQPGAYKIPPAWTSRCRSAT